MHFHLPKPLHGWREFAGEVGIIVLGVLIALAAEQLVETIHDNHVAAQTRSAIADEINNDLAYVQLRATAEPCIGRRLGELLAILEEWGRTGSYKTPRWVAQAPRLSIDLPHFDAASSAGRLALLPRDEQYRIGVVVAGLRGFQSIQEAEYETWANLRTLQSGSAALSVSDRTAIRQSLQRAANLDYGARLAIRQLLPMAEAYGFKPDMRRFHEDAKRIWKNGRYTPAICAAIDTPPEQANAITGQQIPLPF